MPYEKFYVIENNVLKVMDQGAGLHVFNMVEIRSFKIYDGRMPGDVCLDICYRDTMREKTFLMIEEFTDEMYAKITEQIKV